MATNIKFKRGLKTNLPTLAEGEPAFTTDTHEFYIGASDGNKKMGGADSAWVAPTLGEGLSTTFLKYKKIGNTVILQGNITNANATGWQILFYLPEGYRPISDLWIACSVDVQAVGTTNSNIQVSDGRFRAYLSQNAKTYINIRFEVA